MKRTANPHKVLSNFYAVDTTKPRGDNRELMRRAGLPQEPPHNFYEYTFGPVISEWHNYKMVMGSRVEKENSIICSTYEFVWKVLWIQLFTC